MTVAKVRARVAPLMYCQGLVGLKAPAVRGLAWRVALSGALGSLRPLVGSRWSGSWVYHGCHLPVVGARLVLPVCFAWPALALCPGKRHGCAVKHWPVRHCARHGRYRVRWLPRRGSIPRWLGNTVHILETGSCMRAVQGIVSMGRSGVCGG